ncbi:hypothetical protein JCM10908_000353 [Rhodotorula pacifica]|uniref:uncharacterized protein n=1 Tax=Rhodotorula pacifica TaxID=1495444 RepID=UPI00316BE87F
MSHKHVINDPRKLAVDSLVGLGRLNPSLNIDVANRVACLRSVPKDRVAIISGGGSGHEPAHAGFVGDGLLTAAICGNVFASPNVGQIRQAVEQVANDKGTLAVVMRYTGDVLLFGLAKEQQAVTNPDRPFRLTIVGDDVAVGRSQGRLVGRRGLAGTVLVYKLASALADTGAELEDVHALAEYAATRVGTMGAGLDHCHIPGTGPAEAHLAAGEVELGMGIHNESGIGKLPLPSSAELVEKMLAYIIDTTDKERAFLPYAHDGQDEIILLVNNLGGMSELELSSIANDVVEALERRERKITVRRLMVGTVMTSLNLPGFSITTLLLPRESNRSKYSSDQLLRLWDAPASAPGWRFTSVSEPGSTASWSSPSTESTPSTVKSGAAPLAHSDFNAFTRALSAACEAVVAAEPEITRFDTIAGDGDAGLTLKAGAEGVLERLNADGLDRQDVITAVLQIAQVVEKTMDGTSGALYSIWSNALAAGLARVAAASSSSPVSPAIWAEALDHALRVLYDYTAARRPSRTLVDPLAAFTEAYTASQGADFAAAVQAAATACEETKDLVAQAGRAAYVDRAGLQEAQVPDPGAYGVVTILKGIQSTL